MALTLGTVVMEKVRASFSLSVAVTVYITSPASTCLTLVTVLESAKRQSVSQSRHSPTHPITHSPSRSLAQSLTRPVAHSLIH